MHFGSLDYINPLPVAFKNMLPEELQALTVNPDGSDGSDGSDGAPGMRLNQGGKIIFSLFQGQLIGAAVKITTDPAYSA